MFKLRPETTFLLRGTLLLTVFLALWWAVLTPYFLVGLREIASAFLTIEVAPSGDWTLRVPLHRIIPATPQAPAQALRSIDFDVPQADAATFTFSILVLWAVLLAASGRKLRRRPLILGTILVFGAQILSFVGYAEVMARRAAAQLAYAVQSDFEAWYLKVLEYLLTSVAPNLLPVVVALATDRDLRHNVLAWSTSSANARAMAGPKLRRSRGLP